MIHYSCFFQPSKPSLIRIVTDNLSETHTEASSSSIGKPSLSVSQEPINAQPAVAPATEVVNAATTTTATSVSFNNNNITTNIINNNNNNNNNVIDDKDHEKHEDDDDNVSVMMTKKNINYLYQHQTGFDCY